MEWPPLSSAGVASPLGCRSSFSQPRRLSWIEGYDHAGSKGRLLTLPAAEARKDPLFGAAVRKKFNHLWFYGEVRAIVQESTGERLYHIVYEDGDQEDMDAGELCGCLLRPSSQVQQAHAPRTHSPPPAPTQNLLVEGGLQRPHVGIAVIVAAFAVLYAVCFPSAQTTPNDLRSADTLDRSTPAPFEALLSADTEPVDPSLQWGVDSPHLNAEAAEPVAPPPATPWRSSASEWTWADYGDDVAPEVARSAVSPPSLEDELQSADGFRSSRAQQAVKLDDYDLVAGTSSISNSFNSASDVYHDADYYYYGDDSVWLTWKKPTAPLLIIVGCFIILLGGVISALQPLFQFFGFVVECVCDIFAPTTCFAGPLPPPHLLVADGHLPELAVAAAVAPSAAALSGLPPPPSPRCMPTTALSSVPGTPTQRIQPSPARGRGIFASSVDHELQVGLFYLIKNGHQDMVARLDSAALPDGTVVMSAYLAQRWANGRLTFRKAEGDASIRVPADELNPLACFPLSREGEVPENVARRFDARQSSPRRSYGHLARNARMDWTPR